jgi:outer membrane lipoprotein-sorting protein
VIQAREAIVMANRNDSNGDALLQQVIEHLRQQDIPEFPDPEVAVPTNTKGRGSRARSISALRRMAMNRRFQLSAGAIAGMAALLAFLLVWGGIDANPVSAMEKMAEQMRRAKSLKVTLSMDCKLPSEPGKPPVTSTLTETLYWLAPKSYRMEMKAGPHAAVEEGIDIFPAGESGIHINDKGKTFRRTPARLGPESPFMMLDKLSTFSGQADRKLGEKSIGGAKAWGFEIDGKKIDPDGCHGPVEIWLDAESNLPVFIRYDMKITGVPITLKMENFRWNIDLDPKLFLAEAPAGYVEQKANASEYPGPEKVLQGIIGALKTYAELCGGHYPRITRTFAEPVRDEMYEAAGIKLPPTTEQLLHDRQYRKVLNAFQGFAVFNRVLMSNPDAAYYGKTVGPTDKDKVLLRWKLDDGRYQVLFGDLRAEVVTTERLRSLEGK